VNILYHFRTRGTGPESVHISGIATAFEKLGHKVYFSSPTGVDPRETAGADPYNTSGKTKVLTAFTRFCPRVIFELIEIGYNIASFFKNRKMLNALSIDLIYERHGFFLAATAWLARSRKIPLVVEVNELVGDKRIRDQPWLSFIARRLDKVLFRHASVIVVVSPYLKRKIQALGISGNKILVLPNAVDEDTYAHLTDPRAMRKQLGLENQVVIGFVGWFVIWHRLDLLLEAFAELVATRPSLRLVLVGKGPLKLKLQEQIKRLGMEDRVIFTGVLSHQQIPEAIAAMDVCVVPHSNEYRSPLKLFEYMGQGRLVVAPATEPVEMVVRHGENGLLFKAEDEKSLMDALAKGVDDLAFRRKIGMQARHDVLTYYTWRENAKKVLACVDQKTGVMRAGC
jgi:glycosyltransferase involved in cell wall biosynthesis